MSDKRPLERIQDTFEGYGRMVLKVFGLEAYKQWLSETSNRYPGGRRPWPRTLLERVLNR